MEKCDKRRKSSVYILADFEPVNYINACKRVGLDVEYGLDAGRLCEFAGLILPGGGDMDPSFYGQKNVASFDVNPIRDRLSFQAIEYYAENNKPVLGICLGAQYINVAFGGTLNQDIPNHKHVQHFVHIEQNSILQNYFGEKILTNSVHHQCIDKVGKDLSVIARSEDGVIEAISHNFKSILGIQWHPERMEGLQVFELFKNMMKN